MKRIYLRKFIIFALLLLALLISISLSANAHPGSLDEKGGHYDRTTGEYHYHDGLNVGGSLPLTFGLVVWGLILIAAILVGIYSSITERMQRKKDEQEKIRQDRLNKIKQQNDYNYYFDIYSFIDVGLFVRMPSSVFIKDGLPATNDNGTYGLYTVYVAYEGKRYHINPNCSNSIKKETNLAITRKSLLPCKKCVKQAMPTYDWFNEYQRISKIKTEYNIP